MRKSLFVLTGIAALASLGAASSTSPQGTISELKAGNQRFLQGQSSSCRTDTQARQSLEKSQSPKAIVLSCSDSRVPPERIFDQGVGDLFTVRVAGNVLDADALASIEYAVAQLGTKLILVMGHESCGAVKAALETTGGKSAGSPSLNHLVAQIQKNLGTESRATAATDETLRGPAMRNVDAVAQDLLKRSPILSQAVKEKRLQITKAIYGLGSGKTDFWQ